MSELTQKQDDIEAEWYAEQTAKNRAECEADRALLLDGKIMNLSRDLDIPELPEVFGIVDTLAAAIRALP